MFDCGISTAELISELEKEVDIALPVDESFYITVLNSLEQLLYSEVIREMAKITLRGGIGDVVSVDELPLPKSQRNMRFEDIYTIFADDTQLIHTTLVSGGIFQNCYFKTENNIGLNLAYTPKELTIVYFVAPKLKTSDNADTENIMLPLEFIDLVKAKLRAEAYKLVNEEELAAKWINDYNILLETFKIWINGKQASFGA